MVWEILGILFAWTWPIWAFVFVFCLAAAISRAVQEEETGRAGGAAGMLLGGAGPGGHPGRAGLPDRHGSVTIIKNDRGEMR